VPSRDSNSGLPYIKTTHYYLSCAAPYRYLLPTYCIFCNLYMRNSVCKYIRNSAEFRDILLQKIPRNSAEFRGIPYVFQKIPYSVGSQKRTSVDTLVLSLQCPNIMHKIMSNVHLISFYILYLHLSEKIRGLLVVLNDKRWKYHILIFCYNLNTTEGYSHKYSILNKLFMRSLCFILGSCILSLCLSFSPLFCFITCSI
jgi:hypothetical protein